MEETARKLRDFKRALEPLMNELETKRLSVGPLLGGARPFVCDGNPLDCKVFVVGFNPATPMKEDYWETFWDESTGFKFKLWNEKYSDERKDIGKKNPSRTRQIMEWMRTSAGSIPILETNIYSTPTAGRADLPKPMREIDKVFDTLLSELQPKLVIAHGQDAAKHLLSKNLETEVWSVPHFSRSWYKIAAEDLGRRVRTFVNK